MSGDPDRLFAPIGKLEGNISIGDHTLSITKKGRYLYGFFDGCRIFESSSKKNYTEHTVPLLSMILSSFCSKNGSQLKVQKASEGPVDEILDAVRKNKKNLDVELFEIKPDEMEENKPRDISASDNIQNSLSIYEGEVKSFSQNLEETRDLASVLLRTQLPVSMWGSQKVKSVLSSIRTDLESLEGAYERFETASEKAERSAQILSSMIDSSQFHRISKSNIDKTASHIINGFFDIKGTMSRTAQALYPLNIIDGVFKKHTGYPATWFFDSSLFYDFIYNFENLIKNIVRATKIESGSVVPLFAWKVKIIGARPISVRAA